MPDSPGCRKPESSPLAKPLPLRAAELGVTKARDGTLSQIRATSGPFEILVTCPTHGPSRASSNRPCRLVGSQGDSEKADLARERRELATEPESERAELAGIYVSRGLTPELAEQVAVQLMAHDALGAHARDELGMSESTRARPLQAALASAAAFAFGAIPVVVLVWLIPLSVLSSFVVAASLLLLAVLGGLAAQLGGAPLLRGIARVTFWGAVAMACSALVGHLFGAVV
ncbi:MAG: VIT1/CCC1 transporter family protein [Acidobacteriota bacterium]